MKKTITIFCIVASLLIILDSINFGYALMMFLFVGIIPGTNAQLSPEQMFGLFAVATSLIIAHFRSPILRKYYSENPKKHQPTVQRSSNG